jgi:adenylosuccinate synthase
MRAIAVIGSSFGDEGKGLLVDYICSKGDAGVVVRFNGGAQAGHTVVTPDGRRHVFHQVGAGAFCGVPTFLSSFVMVNPIAMFLELRQLEQVGVVPDVFASPECLITTFADMIINRRLEDAKGKDRHGSCGMGINETINRSKVSELKITMADIYNQTNLESKVAQICDKYARFRTGSAIDEPQMAESFLRACKALPEAVFAAGIGQCKDPVFEGAQGLLLDKNNKEYFPHVTRSNTGLKNVLELCKQAGIDASQDLAAWYVTRTYLTRHGAGPLPGEDAKLAYEDDTNLPHDYQGRLRFAPLGDPALKELCNRVNKDGVGANSVKIMATHRDQVTLDHFKTNLSSYGPTRDDVI